MKGDAVGSPGEVQEGLKAVMREFPQGVTVVTAMTKDGPRGLMVSSFTSVSLDPPLVLVSIAKSADLHDAFAGASSYAVNFLADDQRSVSDRFAGRVKVKDRFDGVRHHRWSTGSPIIDGARAAIDCKVWQVYDGGDHTLILGEVVRASVISARKPLVYYAQQYTTTGGPERPAPPSDIVW